MRWLGALAVVLVGAGIYLYLELSGSAKPSPPATGAAAATGDAEPAAIPSNPAPAPQAPAKSVPTARPGDTRPLMPTPSPTPSLGEIAKKGPADLGDPDVAWTEAERQQWLWTATGRFDKGNYPGALEASLEIARRNPGSAWEQDALSVAIKSYCAMSEPDKATALLAKMTDQTGIDGALKGCAEWNVKLAKSP